MELNITKKEPILTIIIPAKNDGFMANFNYRLETTLNTIANSANQLGRLEDLEILISDWGSQVPLKEVLQLDEITKQVTRYLITPPDIAEKEQRDSPFPIVIVQNAAIRRARGQYIMQTDSDVIFTRTFMAKLWEVIDGKKKNYVDPQRALIGSKRRQIPWDVISQSPARAALVEALERYGHELPIDTDHNFGFCATGMMVMHRDMWWELRGYDERLIYWGWMEIDLGLRAVMKHPWFDVSINHDMFIYHMEHYSPETKRETTRSKNPMDRPKHYAPNKENWGLVDLDLKILDYSTPDLKPSLLLM